jgi:uncharacterized protein YhbP (UPF0306 family)
LKITAFNDQQEAVATATAKYVQDAQEVALYLRDTTAAHHVQITRGFEIIARYEREIER